MFFNREILRKAIYIKYLIKKNCKNIYIIAKIGYWKIFIKKSYIICKINKKTKTRDKIYNIIVTRSNNDKIIYNFDM